ncbi:hypothetical protein JMA_00370 [Jeotgalibacillus malaysiensis]|uniref:Uncharacterized protein n=1 Tax=Jeotgalibacillus malaysiensis TaxID=1508404 RepID=A0A0B5AN02_9BACL|nr:hypothetical protein JMA_00370 [Jeotgalibacillus malaysiensis]
MRFRKRRAFSFAELFSFYIEERREFIVDFDAEIEELKRK